MMEGDLKLAQVLARMSTNNSRSNSPARTGSPNPGADGGGTASDDAMKTHASMVLEKIQGFRLGFQIGRAGVQTVVKLIKA
ncbi:hypothetical protein OUZ56_028176 [Daphnia magna]|uniref:Uncharacterized protein n=1 Tax=Daphnia magna TaxID=35525 RepID=A0ABR0B326_9CRUS|nr:hypothetical protein OUZ56_028176 [Daphnia magna]